MKRYLAFLLIFMSFILELKAFEVEGIQYELYPDVQNECYVTYPEGGLSGYEGSVLIPESVVYNDNVLTVSGIGDYAFAGCNNLIAINLPSTIRSIGRNAFQSTSLEEMIVPRGVTEIPDQTFYGCGLLKSVSAPGVELIGNSAFGNCIMLQSVELSEELGYVGNSAFHNCSSLPSFRLNYDGIRLGTSAFSGCSSLASVSLPESLKEIPAYTFMDCTSLEEVEGSENIEIFDDYAFYNCSALPTLILAPKIERIGKNSFGLCSALKLEEICGDGLVIEDYAFTGCRSLEKLEFTGISEIGIESFAHAENLQSISFDESLHYIRERAFSSCGNIVYVGCFAELPPFLQLYSFTDRVYNQATLEVMSGLRLLYMQTPPWSYFKNVTELPDSGIITGIDNLPLPDMIIEGYTLTVRGGTCRVAVYSIDGLLIKETVKQEGDFSVELPARGIYIISINGINKTIIIS